MISAVFQDSGIFRCYMHFVKSEDSGNESVFAAFFSISLAIVSGPGDFPFFRLLMAALISSSEIDSSSGEGSLLVLAMLATFVVLLYKLL